MGDGQRYYIKGGQKNRHLRAFIAVGRSLFALTSVGENSWLPVVVTGVEVRLITQAVVVAIVPEGSCC